MKFLELRKQPEQELRKILSQKGEQLRSLRFGLATGKVKNVREIRSLKKEIARILTIIKENHDKK